MYESVGIFLLAAREVKLVSIHCMPLNFITETLVVNVVCITVCMWLHAKVRGMSQCN